jgi:hypothetical protein
MGIRHGGRILRYGADFAPSPSGANARRSYLYAQIWNNKAIYCLICAYCSIIGTIKQVLALLLFNTAFLRVFYGFKAVKPA